jgi:hypothetical protein
MNINFNEQQFANLVDALRPVPPQPRPEPARAKLEPFEQTGAVEWGVFRDRFTYVAELNLWTPANARMHLVAHMKGPARLATKHIPSRQHENPVPPLEEMLQEYEDIFITPAATAAAKNEYVSCRQKTGESEVDYHSRMRFLRIRAYPQEPAADLEASVDVIDRFLEGLIDSEVAFTTKKDGPATFTAALTACSLAKAHIDWNARRAKLSSGAAINSFQRKETGASRKSTSQPRMSSWRKKMQDNIDSQGRKKCFTCGSVDHMIKDCPKEKKSSAGGKWSGSGGKGKGGGKKGKETAKTRALNYMGKQEAEEEESFQGKEEQESDDDMGN